MCQKCVDAVKRWFPKVRRKDYGDLLMSATAFPMAGPAYIEKQLKGMARKGITTVAAAAAYAGEQMERDMEKIRLRTRRPSEGLRK